eukprot:11032664-Lingulodinium_polyedra.AAC.1
MNILKNVNSKYSNEWIGHQWPAWLQVAADVRVPSSHMIRSHKSLEALKRKHPGREFSERSMMEYS